MCPREETRHRLRRRPHPPRGNRSPALSAARAGAISILPKCLSRKKMTCFGNFFPPRFIPCTNEALTFVGLTKYLKVFLVIFINKFLWKLLTETLQMSRNRACCLRNASFGGTALCLRLPETRGSGGQRADLGPRLCGNLMAKSTL